LASGVTGVCDGSGVGETGKAVAVSPPGEGISTRKISERALSLSARISSAPAVLTAKVVRATPSRVTSLCRMLFGSPARLKMNVTGVPSGTGLRL
jgi:hypothetical protein